MIFSYCADSFCSSLSRSDITDAFIDKLYLNCTDYSVILNGDVLTLYMKFDNVDIIYNEFKRGLGNINTDFYSLYKDNNGVGIQFFF